MSPRRWQNLARYFYDISKLVLASAVITQLVEGYAFQLKVIAFGTGAGVLSSLMGFVFDKRGEDQ